MQEDQGGAWQNRDIGQSAHTPCTLPLPPHVLLRNEGGLLSSAMETSGPIVNVTVEKTG